MPSDSDPSASPSADNRLRRSGSGMPQHSGSGGLSAEDPMPSERSMSMMAAAQAYVCHALID